MRIALRLRRAATPRLPPSVFASGEAWSAHGAAGKRLIAGPRSEEGVPAWTARLGRRRIEIRCGPGYLTGSGRRARIESPLAYPLDQILLVRCLGSAGIVVHGGAAVREGRAAVFAGPSGAGKTTLARLLDAAGWRVLSDDRVVIRRAGRGFTAWGTPWPGEGGFARNEGAPLAGVYLLGRRGRNRVRALAPSEALRGLLPVASVPWYDARELAGPLAVLGAVIAAGLAFSFAFRPGAAAARRLAEHLDAAP